MRLTNASKNLTLAERVLEARGFFARARGLLGRDGLEADTAMWIRSCNSVHTWFMRFSIDVVFVDRDLIVKAVHRDVRPGRLLWPVWGATSVFEFAAGAPGTTHVEKGDRLHVGA